MDITYGTVPPAENTVYRLAGVSKIYRKGGREILAVRDLDLDIKTGEWLAVQGKTGHGKTTLLQLLGGLDRPTKGRVEFGGTDLAKATESQVRSVRASSFGFIFQTFNLVPTLTAAENVEAALIPLGLANRQRRDRTTAALDSGQFNSNSTVNGNSPVTISGVPLSNDNNQSWGPIDLTTTLVNSVNTVWAQVAVQLGNPTMTKYMQRFGFYSKPPLDYPPDELNVSRPFSPRGRPYPPGSPAADIGRIGIGQGGLQVTPLQMALVVAAVANGGKLMVPHLTARVVNADGVTVKTIKPMVYNQVMKPSTAQALTQMMTKVVEEGTGTAAQLGGISVAGKTGTAEIGTQGSGLTEPWFIGFAPVDHPTVAVAVTVDKTQGGFGGTVAAPIAKDIIQTLLNQGQ